MYRKRVSMMKKARWVVFVAAGFGLRGVGFAKDEPIRISTITNASQPASAEMMRLFRQKIAERDTLFKLVGNDDAAAGVVFQADCLSRPSKDDPYVCFYTLHYAGATNKTLMGGGVNSAKTANEIADWFLASVAQDIVEGLSHAARTNAVESLEACFRLTQSSCAVPEVLVPEMKARILNLSQYLQKGGLNRTGPAQEK
jgi:hypothetical protein